MPSKNTSPYATTFKSAIKRGTPCSVAVNNIATRTKKSPTVIYNSLFKAGLCFRQKFNGQWVYWACDGKKSNATTTKSTQWNMWQCFVDWCIASGHCTPEQLNKHCSSQTQFMNYCKKFWSKQFSTTSGSRKSGKTGRKTGSTTPKSYKFPTAKGRTGNRRFRKAA